VLFITSHFTYVITGFLAPLYIPLVGFIYSGERWLGMDQRKVAQHARERRFFISTISATRLGDREASAFEIAQIMGWSDIRMAIRYTYATGDGIRRAMNLLTQTEAGQGR